MSDKIVKATTTEVNLGISKKQARMLQKRYPEKSTEEALEQFSIECLVELKDPQEELNKLERE